MFLIFPKYSTRFIRFKYRHLAKFYFPAIKTGFRDMGWVYKDFFKKMLFGMPAFYIGLILCLFLYYPFHNLLNDHLLLLMNFWLSAVIVCMIVYIPAFRSVGEAHRYMEFAIYPFSFIAVYFFDNIHGTFLYYGLLLVFLQFYIFRVFKLKHENDLIKNNSRYVEDLLTFLKGSKNKTILSIPAHQFSYYLMRYTSHRFVQGVWLSGLETFYPVFAKFQIPRTDLDYIYSKYKFDFVLVDRIWLAGNKWKYDFSGLKKIFSNKKFFVYLKEDNLP
jgi:hypothetical protein